MKMKNRQLRRRWRNTKAAGSMQGGDLVAYGDKDRFKGLDRSRAVQVHCMIVLSTERQAQVTGLMGVNFRSMEEQEATSTPVPTRYLIPGRVPALRGGGSDEDWERVGRSQGQGHGLV